MSIKSKFDKDFFNAFKIGSVSIFIYLISYVSRNLLTVVTPAMTKSGIYTKGHLGMLTSVYFAVYSIGQLVNGVIGERIKSKYMIFIGCFLSGIGMALFPLFHNDILNFIAFALLGFGLSMLRGPIMKIISENLKPQSAETISVLLTVAAFAGPLIAGFFSILFDWKMTFYITAIFAVLFAFGSFLILTVFEKKKLITFTYKKENIFSGIRRLFCFKNFLFYLIVGAIAEIVASSVTYWIPSYLSEYLSLSTESIAAVFSLISLINIISPLICVFLYHRLIKDNVKLNLIFFGIAIVFFLLLSVSQSSPIANICFFIIAKTAIGCSSTTLWGIYIPSLASENVVSTGNGFFDFSGYAIASIFNALFSGFIDRLGWDGIILMWVFIMVIGFLSTLTVIIKDRHTADVDID